MQNNNYQGSEEVTRMPREHKVTIETEHALPTTMNLISDENIQKIIDTKLNQHMAHKNLMFNNQTDQIYEAMQKQQSIIKQQSQISNDNISKKQNITDTDFSTFQNSKHYQLQKTRSTKSQIIFNFLILTILISVTIFNYFEIRYLKEQLQSNSQDSLIQNSNLFATKDSYKDLNTQVEELETSIKENDENQKSQIKSLSNLLDKYYEELHNDIDLQSQKQIQYESSNSQLNDLTQRYIQNNEQTSKQNKEDISLNTDRVQYVMDLLLYYQNVNQFPPDGNGDANFGGSITPPIHSDYKQQTPIQIYIPESIQSIEFNNNTYQKWMQNSNTQTEFSLSTIIFSQSQNPIGNNYIFMHGLQSLHDECNQEQKCELLIQFNKNDQYYHAIFNEFWVKGIIDVYELNLNIQESYEDNQDNFDSQVTYEYAKQIRDFHNKNKWSTNDQDNDNNDQQNCAQNDDNQGPGWYNNCYLMSLFSNSRVGKGITFYADDEIYYNLDQVTINYRQI